MSFDDRDPIAAFAAPCLTPERITIIARALAESIGQQADRRHVLECAGCQAELERVMQELNAEPAGFIPSEQLAARTVAWGHSELAGAPEPRAPLLERALARVGGRPMLSRPSFSPAHEGRRRRVAMAFGIAAAVMLTLLTGIVLGASASYASAEVIDAHQREANTSTIASTRRLASIQLDLARAYYDQVQADFKSGAASEKELSAAGAEVELLRESIAQIDLELSASRAVTLPPRPPLAILPIRTALTALSCLPAMPSSVKLPTVTPVLAEASTALAVPEVILTPARIPDRARIAALATQHQPAVVRGETAADYIVMALDAANQYVWSTSGSGNFRIEVGGDSRTAAERREYSALHRAELMGSAAAAGGGSFGGAGGTARGGGGGGARGGDSLFASDYMRALGGDSLVLRYRTAWAVAGGTGGRDGRGGGADTTAAVYTRRGRGAGGDTVAVFTRFGRGGTADSVAARYSYVRLRFDSLGGDMRRYTLGFSFDSLPPGVSARGGGSGGRGARGGGAGSTDAPPTGSYITGFSSSMNTTTNDGVGLEEAGSGQSGIQGLAATSVSSLDAYSFPAGELSPRALRIFVVHLAPGTVWKGR